MKNKKKSWARDVVSTINTCGLVFPFLFPSPPPSKLSWFFTLFFHRHVFPSFSTCCCCFFIRGVNLCNDSACMQGEEKNKLFQSQLCASIYGCVNIAILLRRPIFLCQSFFQLKMLLRAPSVENWWRKCPKVFFFPFWLDELKWIWNKK